MQLFCVNCGRPYEAPQKFCNSCGKPLPVIDFPAATVAPLPPPVPVVSNDEMVVQTSLLDIIETEPLLLSKEIVPSSMPYARFTWFAILAMLLSSVLAFVVLDDVYRRKAYLVPFGIATCLGLSFCLKQAHSGWTRIGTYGDKNSLALRTRKALLRRLAIFSILSLAGGMIIGAMVGQSGMKTESYIDDIAVYSAIGDRISQARNTAKHTIEGQLEMYRKIEPDVVALKPIVERLKQENTDYASRYPADHQITTNSATAFERTGKRDELLLRQIAVAKEIANVVGEENQLAIYREKMMPILTAEDQIDER